MRSFPCSLRGTKCFVCSGQLSRPVAVQLSLLCASPSKTHQEKCILLRVISFRADPMSPRTWTASVSHLFLLLLGSSGSLPWPRPLPFHLVPTPGQEREASFLFPVPVPGLSLMPGQTPRTLVLPLASFCQSGLLLSLSSDSGPLTWAHPDLRVLECQSTHVAKELNLLDSLALQTGRAQRRFLTSALCQRRVLATAASTSPAQSCGSELMGHSELFIGKER